VCYSLNTFLALREKPECRVILCGGEFHASNAISNPESAGHAQQFMPRISLFILRRE
jgi:DeoR/GlpR family transcriptional regulator of sugar metabolism